MSSEYFESQEDELQCLFEEIGRKTSQKLTKLSGEPKKKCIREIERGLDEGNQLIRQMEDEARKAPPKYRMDMVARLKKYRQEADNFTKLLEKSSQQTSQRPNLFLSPEQRLEAAESAQRNRLLVGTESLNRASESIARSQQISAETDEIGVGIIDELDTQRDQLLRTRDRLTETDGNLRRSRKILQKMARRIITNKLVLIFIILLELGILAGVIYWKFFS